MILMDNVAQATTVFRPRRLSGIALTDPSLKCTDARYRVCRRHALDRPKFCNGFPVARYHKRFSGFHSIHNLRKFGLRLGQPDSHAHMTSLYRLTSLVKSPANGLAHVGAPIAWDRTEVQQQFVVFDAADDRRPFAP